MNWQECELRMFNLVMQIAFEDNFEKRYKLLNKYKELDKIRSKKQYRAEGKIRKIKALEGITWLKK